MLTAQTTGHGSKYQHPIRDDIPFLISETRQRQHERKTKIKLHATVVIIYVKEALISHVITWLGRHQNLHLYRRILSVGISLLSINLAFSQAEGATFNCRGRFRKLSPLLE